jgi:hypothetical protein
MRSRVTWVLSATSLLAIVDCGIDTGSAPSDQAVGGQAGVPGSAGGAMGSAGGSFGGSNTNGGGGNLGGSRNPGGGNPGRNGAGGLGGVTASGGAFAMGGGPSNGGLASTGGAARCGVTVVDPSTLPPCTTCTGGRCVAKADYPAAPLNILDACDAQNVCIPDSVVATKGNVLLPTCTSVAGAEGRCASLCIPIVRSLSGVLPQGNCATDERCAPCDNPNDGSSTGICAVGCDPGPTKPPTIFPQCCGGIGRCIPRADIPGAAASSLPKVDCPAGNDPVCVPSVVVSDPTYRFPSCTTSLPAAPGACAPACIVNAIPNGNLLGQGTCANSTDKCAPCTNPLTGQPTGACSP